MIVVGREILSGFIGNHPTARSVVAVWLADVSAAAWATSEEIKAHFPMCRTLPGRLVVFEFSAPAFSITVQVAFTTGVIVVLGATQKEPSTAA